MARGHEQTISITLRRISVIALSAILLVASGCGGVEIAPVSGTITVDGQPAGPGVIIFLPVNSKEKIRSAMAQFGDDGRYELTTLKTSDGAAIGKHRVIIQSPSNESAQATQRAAIPFLYADPQVSGLTAQVEQGSQTIDFPLTSSR